MTLLDYALAAHAAGLAVLPPREDGSKAPDTDRWKHLQTNRSDEATVRAWYANGRAGIGTVCGAVAGQLEMFEFEGRAVDEGLPQTYRQLVEAAGLGPVLDRIRDGYCEQSPSGGFHLLYRIADGPASPCTALARRPARPDEHTPDELDLLARKPHAKVVRTLMEVKGEGGYTILAPSAPPVHPDGHYRLLSGGLDTIATVSVEERDELHRIARMLDQFPDTPPRDRTAAPTSDGGQRPGDLYGQAPDVQDRTRQLLEDHGWGHVYTAGHVDYLRRPGKRTGISASLGHIGPGVLRVFTTSTSFEDRAYSPFAVYAHLDHDDDHTAAARALANLGFTTRTPLDPITILDRPPRADEQNEYATEHAGPALEFHTFAALAAEVDAAGPRTWLLRGVWPQGDYGVHHAAAKAQKSWNTVDLAVSVATGTDWLGHVPIDTPGPVVMFWGEGGKGNVVRRIRAIARSRGIDTDDIPIDVCVRAPHLSDAAHLREMADRIGKVHPSLVIIDPLYLAARGADKGDLYSMGGMLEAPQRICQAVGASLWIVHHDNRAGGHGAARASGAGPWEWGRVIVSATVKASQTDPETRRTTKVTALEVVGGEVPDTSYRVTRRVWADDPDDLDSPMHVETEVEANDGVPTRGDRGDDLKPSEAKLLEALEAGGPDPQSSSELVDWIAEHHGHGLKRETASRGLNRLYDLGYADRLEQAPGRSSLWLPTRDVTRDQSRVIPVTAPKGGHGSQVTGHTPPTSHPPVTPPADEELPL